MEHGARQPDDFVGGRALFVFNSGFLTQARVKRILALSGYNVRLGKPGADDIVGVWGMSPTAHRGEAVAKRQRTSVLRVEDAWLRSLFPGRDGEPPIGLTLDTTGLHYDASGPSDLEILLATHPLDDTALLDRARGALERLKETHLTKYAAVEPDHPAPPPGYVLVIDQTREDASVRSCGADRNRFLEMLFVAREENPSAPIIIKSHPETVRGHRQGHYSQDDLSENVEIFDGPISPWTLFEGAIAVYTVSSQLGFEAIFAGHKPRVFGTPFYAGWGLTEDEITIERRQRKLSRAQLFAAAVLLYPVWYDPIDDTLCEFETALEHMAARARSWREDRRGWIASEMSLWKRHHLNKIFGQFVPIEFENDTNKVSAANKPRMIWASKSSTEHKDVTRVEDGFLRSRGLGAELIPPLSLVLDDLGIYYDPNGPSRLEKLIALRETLRPDQENRALTLIRSIVNDGLSKYNLDGDTPSLPEGERILVVGQVEDDASLIYGCDKIHTNLQLLEATRQAHPNACLIYKPHPDVEAGLRGGGEGAEALADFVATNTDIDYMLNHVDRVWTMTSLTGFEALLRNVPVTTVGIPFYAGWQLTTDLARIPPRRRASPSLAGLVYATLIDYPRYFHPTAQLPCSVEAAVAWLAQPEGTTSGRWQNRLLSKLQGIFAGKAHWWRQK